MNLLHVVEQVLFHLSVKIAQKKKKKEAVYKGQNVFIILF